MKRELCNLVICYSKIDKLHEQERQLWMNELKVLVEKNSLLQEAICTRVLDADDCPDKFAQQIKDLQDSNERYKNFYEVMKSAMETNTDTIKELQDSQISLYKKILRSERNSNPHESTWSQVEEKLECDPLSNQQASKNATHSETTTEESGFQDVGGTFPSFAEGDQVNKDRVEPIANNYESQPQKYGVLDVKIVIENEPRAEVAENEEVTFLVEENRILKSRILDLEKLSCEKSEEVGELRAQIDDLRNESGLPRVDLSLEEENLALRSKIFDLEKLSSDNSEEVGELRAQIDDLRNENSFPRVDPSFEEENLALRSKIFDLEKLSSEKSEEVGELRAQIDRLKSADSLPRVDLFLGGENRALKAKILDLEKQSIQDAKEVAELTAHNDGLKHENSLLKGGYYSGEECGTQKPSSENVADVTSVMDGMIDEDSLLMTPILEFSALDESVKTQMLMKIISSKKTVNDGLKSQIRVLKIELEKARAQKEDIDTSVIKQLETKVEDLQSELTSKITEMRRLESRNLESSNLIGDLSDQLTSKDDFINSLEAQLSEVGTAKEAVTLSSDPTFNSQKEMVETEQGAFMRVQAYLEGKVEELNSKVSQNEETINGLTSQLEAKDTESKKLRNLLNAVEGRYETLKDNFDSQTRVVHELEYLIFEKDKDQTVRLCEDLRGRLAEAETQSRIFSDRVTDLTRELAENKENQRLLESDLDDKKLEVQAKDEKIKELSDVANTCSEDLRAENLRLNGLYEELVESSKQLETELGEKNTQINFLSATFSGEIDKVSQSVKKIKGEFVKIKGEQEEKNIEMAGIYRQYVALTTESENLLSSKFKLESELATVGRDIETKSSPENDREVLVETEATSMSKPPQRNLLERDNSALVKYLETIHQLEKDNKSLTSKVEDLERDLLESKICEEESQNKVKTMKKELGDKDEELKTLKGKIEDQIEEILSAKEMARDQNSTFKELKTLIEHKEAQIDSMVENIGKLEGNLSEQSNEANELRAMLESSREENTLMKDVLDNKDDEVKVLRDCAKGQSEETERLRGDLADKVENIRILEDTLNSRYLESKKLERDLENAEEELESLRNCLRNQDTTRTEGYDAEIQSMRDRLVAKDNEIEFLRNKLGDVDGEIQLLKGNMLAKEDEINTLRSQLDQVGDQEGQVEKILNEYNQLKVDYENYVKTHERMEEDLKMEISKNAEMSSTLRRQESALGKSMNVDFEYPPECDDKLPIDENIILQSINFLRGRERTPDDDIKMTPSVKKSKN